MRYTNIVWVFVLYGACSYIWSNETVLPISSSEKKSSVGLLIVATGKYVKFVEPLIKSAEQYFLPGHERTFFVFTDHQYEVPKSPHIVTIYQKRLGWPYDTMMRCKMYLDHTELYAGIDYLYAIDADTLVTDIVGDEILSDLVATRHPCFEGGKRGNYEWNPQSVAYVAPHEGTNYFAGGFYGGKTENFIAMNQTMYEHILIDLDNGIMPRFHDESHLNRYFIDNKPTLILSPEYCWAPHWSDNFHCRMLIVQKSIVETDALRTV